MIAAVVVLLTGLFRNLPEPILDAVILMAIKNLIDLGELRHVRRDRRLGEARGTPLHGRAPGTDVFSDIMHNPGKESVPGALTARVEGTLLNFKVDHVRSELIRGVEAQERPASLVVLDLGLTRARAVATAGDP